LSTLKKNIPDSISLDTQEMLRMLCFEDETVFYSCRRRQAVSMYLHGYGSACQSS
jgi:hypothetical protein